jgi:hypothetical protein
MKRIALLVLFCACCAAAAQAQGYKSAIGLRLGSPLSVSFKTFITEPGAIEANVGFRSYGFSGYRYSWINLSAAYQHHFPIDVSGIGGNLQWCTRLFGP